jgi:hypothetical protein
MNKGIALLAMLAVTTSVYAEDHVITAEDYQATLAKYEEFKPLAGKVLLLSRHLVSKAEDISEEADPAYKGQSIQALNKNFAALKKMAAPLGDATFVEPFGYCGVLPDAAQNYATSLITNNRNNKFEHDFYQQTDKDCKTTTNTKPRDKTGLAILDLSDDSQS